MFNTGIGNCFRRHQNLLRNDSVAMAYAVIEVRNYLWKWLALQFQLLTYQTFVDTFIPCYREQQQESNLDFLCSKMKGSTSSLNRGPQNVFHRTIGAVLPGFTSSNDIDSSLSLSPCNFFLVPSPCFPSLSPSNTQSKYPFRLFLLDTPGSTD